MTELQPRGWLITYNISGAPHTVFSGHNCVGDYLHFNSTAKAEAVYNCLPEVLDELLVEIDELRKDVGRWRLAGLYSDNAETLYAAVLNNEGDQVAINAEFDAAMLAKGEKP